MVFRRRHAGGRLIEQQQLRPLRQRDGDFDKPLPSVWQLAHRLAGVRYELERLQVVERLVDDSRSSFPADRHRRLQAPVRSPIAR